MECVRLAAAFGSVELITQATHLIRHSGRRLAGTHARPFSFHLTNISFSC